jgi:putative adenylate-forming enzyme
MNRSEKLAIATHFLRARWRWRHLRGQTLEHYQENRAQQIVTYTQQHSPFYRQHWTGQNPRDWRTLPVVDKHLMMTNFDTFNTRRIRRETAMEIALQAERTRDFSSSLDGVTIGLSSGTSGHRGLFLASQEEQAAWAGTILARTLHHLSPRRLRVAFFLRSNSNLYEQVGGGLIHFCYFDLMLPLDEVVSALNNFQPHIIIGPPSLLGFLAHASIREQLHIKPKRLISVAEVLEEQEKQRIEATFQIPVHQIYQCTEGLLAVSCEQGSLHIQEDAVILQFEALPGSDGQRVMPIVTDLWRKTQPIIRYRLNDVLQLESRACPCGSPFRVIRSIEGRCDDICYFESLTGGPRPFFPDTIRRMILLASPDITDYQVIQQRYGQISIYLSIASDASFENVSTAVLASVNATVAQYVCQPAVVQIEPGITPPVPGAKHRRVQAQRTE